MQLDWSTLALEILNFLVLVWLLQRFLYRPILNVVTTRQAAIEAATQRAHETQEKAATLQAQYESRLQTWEQERAKARADLQEELRAARERALAALHDDLEQERRKTKVLNERLDAEEATRREREAIRQGLAFVRRLLSVVSGPELEGKLVQLAVDELERLPEQRRSALREALQAAAEPPVVSSAYPLSPKQREVLAQALRLVFEKVSDCRFEQDASLVAGVRINVGPWVLHASLGEELELFAAAAADDGH
jgi:F-type H+-transporting ATPase subunit b